MFSNIEHDWCRVSFEKFEGFASYLTDPFIDILNIIKNGSGVITCDEEGSDFDIIFNSEEFYIVSNRESSIVYRSERNTNDIIEEIVSDIEGQFEAVVNWNGKDESFELLEQRKEELLTLLKEIKAKNTLCSLNEFFDSLLNEINRFDNQANLEQSLLDFAQAALAKSEEIAFCPKEICFNVEDYVKYWIHSYQEQEKTGKKLKNSMYRECAESLVFSILCNIDGVCSDNNFTVVRTVFDTEEELHSQWCQYLRLQEAINNEEN